jgi:hypothetical protein
MLAIGMASASTSLLSGNVAMLSSSIDICRKEWLEMSFDVVWYPEFAEIV